MDDFDDDVAPSDIDVNPGDPNAPSIALGYMMGVQFPAKKQDLVNYAKAAGARQNIINELRVIPDRKYDSIHEVDEALKKARV